jgi:hypothetical protein
MHRKVYSSTSAISTWVMKIIDDEMKESYQCKGLGSLHAEVGRFEGATRYRNRSAPDLGEAWQPSRAKSGLE